MSDKALIDFIESISKIYATQPPLVAKQMVKVMTDIAQPKQTEISKGDNYDKNIQR